MIASYHIIPRKLNIEEEDRRLDHQSHRYISQCGTLTTVSSDLRMTSPSCFFVLSPAPTNIQSISKMKLALQLLCGMEKLGWIGPANQGHWRRSWRRHGGVSRSVILGMIFICALLIMSSLMFVSLSLNLTSLSFSTYTLLIKETTNTPKNPLSIISSWKLYFPR